MRVIYYWRLAESQVVLVAAFAKSVRTDLSRTQLKVLTRTLKEWHQ